MLIDFEFNIYLILWIDWIMKFILIRSVWKNIDEIIVYVNCIIIRKCGKLIFYKNWFIKIYVN